MSSHTLLRTASSRTMPFLTPSALGLELRLYQRQDLRARREQIADGRQHELERDETHVDGGEVGRVRQTRRIELADIGLLDADDVVAAAQPRVQLAGADVDRVDPLGAAREQHLGEAAGRGAGVEANAAGDVETEMIERGGKLDAAARHIGVLGLGGDDGGGGHFLRGFANGDAVGGHASGGDRGLRPRAAVEQAARDQQAIGSFAMGHGCNYTTVMAGLVPAIHAFGSAMSLRRGCPAQGRA